MTVFAIGDLHLPAEEKPMDVFGDHWKDHFERISEDWRNKVQPDDIVLVPGDITWAMQLSAAKPDLMRIGELPGRKIITRGNHDYWWGSIGRVREALPEGMYALQNDAMLLDGVAFAGSRGWTLPAAEEGEDFKIYSRELIRMEMSLERASKLKASRLVMMTHYPPLDEKHNDTPVSQLIEKYGVTDSGIAIAWLLRLPDRMQPIVGSVNELRINDIAKAADIELTRKEWYDLYLAAGYTLP